VESVISFLSFFFKKKRFIYLLYVKYTVAVFRQPRRGHQISLRMVVNQLCGCWDLNSGPLEEQSELITAELSIQPQLSHFTFIWIPGFNLGQQMSTANLYPESHLAGPRGIPSFLLFFFFFFFLRFIYLLYISTL
jgi:hypothetical protein